MTSEDLRFVENELNKSRDELLAIIVELRKALAEETGYRVENSTAITAMYSEFQKNKKELEEALRENRELKSALTLVAEKNQLKTKELFGRGTEKLSDLFDAVVVVEEEDESSVVIIDFSSAAERKSSLVPIQDYHAGKNRGRKRIGKRKEDLSKLPQQQIFLLHTEELDSLYGSGNWRIAYWRCHTTVEHNPAVAYALNTFTPVISVGLEHSLVSVPYQSLLSRSFASASLVAQILFQKFFMAVPLYRQELSFSNFGVSLSRQTMCNWVLRFSAEYFGPVYDCMLEHLMSVSYHQCDETTILVNKDGRRAGAKSYLWVHITSELAATNPVILFCYELTRSTDHLRKFYEDFKGFITCDAYCSYQVLEDEKKNVIIVCGCMMHMRRRFVDSLSLIDKSKLDAETIQQLPETQALIRIGKIYDADEPLKLLIAEERKLKRDTLVRPLVEEYYSYIEGLDLNDPTMSNRLRNAINYSLNQKEHLCRFLEDGNIPIDDGATERHIRPFTIGRNNFLFCDSIEGAKAAAIMYTMVETAKANNTNVYYYLRYVLEEMPKHMDATDRSFLKTMLPWSEEYRAYEKEHTAAPPPLPRMDGYSVPPKTPRKSDIQLTQAYSGVA